MSSPREDVAVVGAGLMGCGIAQVLAVAGHRVALYDPDPVARDNAAGRLRSVLDDLGIAEASGSVDLHGELGPAVEAAELVIEAGPERLDVKRRIFADLERLAPAGATLATNTSAIPIGEIAAAVDDRWRVVGTHFWNPPHLVTLVEVIEAEGTSAEVVAGTLALLDRAGMNAVHVKSDIPGFIGNRLQHALKREAIALVAGGHCTAETVDEVVKHGFGARLAELGPLEQSDLIGLGLTLDIHRVLMPDLDRTASAHPYLVEKVESGETGASVGKGFREWAPGSAEDLRKNVTEKLIERRRRQMQALDDS